MLDRCCKVKANVSNLLKPPGDAMAPVSSSRTRNWRERLPVPEVLGANGTYTVGAGKFMINLEQRLERMCKVMEGTSLAAECSHFL
jgi:hypothetical protein